MFQTLAYYATVFHRRFAAYTTRRLEPIHLSFGSLFFIIYVGKHPNCTQAELTENMKLDWGHSQRSITKLVEEGFLSREKTGRAYHLNLCPKGQEAFQLSHQVFFDWDQQKLSVLSEEERKTLFSLLQKIAGEEEG